MLQIGSGKPVRGAENCCCAVVGYSPRLGVLSAKIWFLSPMQEWPFAAAYSAYVIKCVIVVVSSIQKSVVHEVRSRYRENHCLDSLFGTL